MAQDAQLISQAGQVESLASDGLVSVSTGAGQPQKNMELAKFADSLGSSVPLQQTSEQVAITGLYARTSDGKMVELTSESVASVVAGLMPRRSRDVYNETIVGGGSDVVKVLNTGTSKWMRKTCQITAGRENAVDTCSVELHLVDNGVSVTVYRGANFPTTIKFGYFIESDGSASIYIKSDESAGTNIHINVISASVPIKYQGAFNWSKVTEITPKELSSAVAQQMNTSNLLPLAAKGNVSFTDFNEMTYSGAFRVTGISSIANKPNVSANGMLEVIVADSKSSVLKVKQIYTVAVAGYAPDTYMRILNTDTWTDWVKINFNLAPN